MSVPKSHVMSDDTRLALLEQSIGHIDHSLLRIDKKIDKLDKDNNDRFIVIEGKFEKVDSKFDKIDSKFDKIDGQLKWMTTTILTLFTGLYGVMFAGGISWVIAKICHWS